MAYPPVHLHEPARYLSAEETASHISTYLSQAAKNPYLHPDAIFNASGIHFGNYGGSAGGLVLHQLRRVEKGLRGERIAVADIDQVELDDGDDDIATAAAGGNASVEGFGNFVSDLQKQQQQQREQGETATNLGKISSTYDENGKDESSNLAPSQETSQGKRGKKRKAPSNSIDDSRSSNPARGTSQSHDDTSLQVPDIPDTEAAGDVKKKNQPIDGAEYVSQVYSDQHKNQRKLEKKKRQKLHKKQKAEKLGGKNA